MTCCDCKCYYEHPAGIQLTRLTVLVICFLIRFVSVILGALCATKFSPTCVPYTVLSSLFLIPSLVILSVEIFHFHLLWNYLPLEDFAKPRVRRNFLRFFPFNMTYDARGKEYGLPADDIGCQCDSVCLAHSVLYHSATVLPALPLPPLMDSKVVIAYHVTSKEKAMEILENGFPVDKRKQVKDEVFFHLHVPTTTTPGTSEEEVIICARLCMDHVLQVDNADHFNFNKHATKTPEPKGLELMPQRKIKVKFPRQIEKWMVIFRSDILNSIHPSGYQGLV